MKLLPLLKNLPVILAVITCVAFVSVYQAVENERSIVSKHETIRQLGVDLMSASDYLTDQSRGYVVTGDIKYYNNYIDESNNVKRRENAIVQLIELGAPKEELELLSDAKLQSSGLQEIENLAFDYVSAGDLQTAQNIIFGDVYYREKEPIKNALVQFRSIVDKRCAYEVDLAQKQATISLIIAFASMLGTVLVVIVNYSLISSKIKVINYIEESLTKINDGDFNVDVDASKEKSNSEVGVMSRGFMRLIETIYKINSEISELFNEAEVGNFTKRVDVSKFDGEWENIMVQLNKLPEVFFEKTINSAPLAYAIIIDGVIQKSNAYAKKNLGFVPGNRLETYFDIKEEADRIINLMDSNGLITGEEVRLKTNYASSSRYYISINTLESAKSKTAVMWGIDIEEDRAKSGVIKQSQENMQQLINAMPVAMIVLDQSTSAVIYCNNAYLKMFGFDTQEDALQARITGMYAKDQPGGESALEVDGRYRKIISGSKDIVTAEFRFKTARGNEFDAKVYGGEIIYNGNRSIVEIIHDISAEKKQALMLRNAAEKEKEANKLKSRFMVNMCHEIRTPLNAITGLSQVALLKNQNGANFHSFKKINLSSKNLLTIINDILDFSKIEADRLDLVEQEFYLEDVISNAFIIVSERAENKKIEILLDVSDECPYFLFGDKTRLWQILKNLLDNAAKFTNEGRVVLKINVDKWETDINGAKSKVYITIKVIDTGIGMSSSQINRMFEPFEQFNQTEREAIRGTGLGMSITKRLVNLMGGSLSVESEVGEGTCVTVNLGFRVREDVPTKRDIFAKRELRDLSVLVIDDDETERDIIKNLLSLIGAKVVCVSNGNDAVEQTKLYDESGNPFKLIILDYLLINENGIEISKRLKPYIKDNPELLMVSAYSKQLLSNDMHLDGFYDIIEKPFVPTLLVQRINDALNARSGKKISKCKQFMDIKVLLCEENIINQYVAAGMFEMLGIVPAIAANGIEALELLEKEQFDIVYMDILMPVMDGHTTAINIRSSDAPYKDIPIIALMTNVLQEEVDLCLAEGMNGYLAMPIYAEGLYDTLIQHLPQKAYGI